VQDFSPLETDIQLIQYISKSVPAEQNKVGDHSKDHSVNYVNCFKNNMKQLTLWKKIF
jgi:hypothetical protein